MLYNILLLLFRIFSYIGSILLFFYFFLYLGSSYIFSGDIVHGTGSYLLILHSTLALLFTQFLYAYFIFLFIIFILLLFGFSFFYVIHFLYVIIQVHIIFSLLNITLFFFSGVIWGDYAWGFPLSLEYRFFLLFACLFLYCYTLLFLNYFIFFDFQYLRTAFFIYCCIIIFVFFLLNYDVIFAVINAPSNISRIELHQSDKSLHFFLLSISGYYISLIFIFYLYNIVIYILSLFLYILFLEETKGSYDIRTNRNYFFFFFN